MAYDVPDSEVEVVEATNAPLTGSGTVESAQDGVLMSVFLNPDRARNHVSGTPHKLSVGGMVDAVDVDRGKGRAQLGVCDRWARVRSEGRIGIAVVVKK